MKVEWNDQNNMVIFLPAPSFELNFSLKDEMEDYFRTLFLKLDHLYNLNFEGFYHVAVYHDKYYGVILEIEKEDLPYIDCLEQQIEMSIHIMNEPHFLYQLEDILPLPSNILNNSKCYLYQNQFFIELTNEISYFDYVKLLEYATIVFGKKAKKIIGLGKKIELVL